MADQIISITIPDAKVAMALEGFLTIYPNTEKNPDESLKYTDKLWVKEMMRRILIIKKALFGVLKKIRYIFHLLRAFSLQKKIAPSLAIFIIILFVALSSVCYAKDNSSRIEELKLEAQGLIAEKNKVIQVVNNIDIRLIEIQGIIKELVNQDETK